VRERGGDQWGPSRTEEEKIGRILTKMSIMGLTANLRLPASAKGRHNWLSEGVYRTRFVRKGLCPRRRTTQKLNDACREGLGEKDKLRLRPWSNFTDKCSSADT